MKRGRLSEIASYLYRNKIHKEVYSEIYKAIGDILHARVDIVYNFTPESQKVINDVNILLEAEKKKIEPKKTKKRRKK